jgi:hypothetical protein
VTYQEVEDSGGILVLSYKSLALGHHRLVAFPGCAFGLGLEDGIDLSLELLCRRMILGVVGAILCTSHDAKISQLTNDKTRFGLPVVPNAIRLQQVARDPFSQKKQVATASPITQSPPTRHQISTLKTAIFDYNVS